ncbi:hypothetical protein [Clostridium sp.]|uniref:hypothetical protein n=1 Tax=Clostridium sp. TaxID=1506 RepID=UPI002FC999DC
MYKYKILWDEKNLSIMKKIQIKRLLLRNLISIVITDILLFGLFYFLYKMNDIKELLVYFVTIVILVQITSLIVYSIKKNNEMLEELNDIDLLMNFNEEGIEFECKDIYKYFTWDGISSIKVFDEYLIINHDISWQYGKIVLFDGFEATKETIISEFEKFNVVRRA